MIQIGDTDLKDSVRDMARRRPPRFLVIRHEPLNPHFYDVILQWVQQNLPELRPLFELHTLPFKIPQSANYVLHIPWMQDPVQWWSMQAYEQANQLAAECDARGIPIINRVDRLINATKSVAARLIASTGIRSPRMVRIRNVEEFKETLLGMSLPLFVREDWGHGGEFYRVDKHADALAIPFERIARPVAVELIDLPDRRTGLYRKYRYIAAGDEGVSHHLQISETWIVRGEHRVRTDETTAEELAYVSKPDPNHEALQRARKALGLDFVAFDYSYDYDGRMIVWEANPYPQLKISRRMVHRKASQHRTILAIVKLYACASSLPITIGRTGATPAAVTAT